MPSPLSIDILHTLQNILDMYKYDHEEVLVLEAVANGIDAKASHIDIVVDADCISFHNDGPPMNKRAFDNYHTISSSTKRKGEGIGFAGVGAKIYLASWSGASIITITGKDGVGCASRMYRSGKKILYDTKDGSDTKILAAKLSAHRYGTSYVVTLNPKRVAWMAEHITPILQFWFSHAIETQRLSISVNGQNVEPWRPNGEVYDRVAQYDRTKVPCRIYVSSNTMPKEMLDVSYHVFGKRITNDRVDFAHQIREHARDKVVCVADMSPLAKHLVANKEDFHRNFPVNKARSAIKRLFYTVLLEAGMIVTQSRAEPSTDKVTGEIEKNLSRALLEDDLRMFSLLATKTAAAASDVAKVPRDGQDGNGSDSHIDTPTPSRETPPSTQEDPDSQGPRRRTRGISIIKEEYPMDTREGWISISDNAVVYNSGHKFSKTMTKSEELYRYNLARVVASTLIKHKSEQDNMDAKTALGYLEKILQRIQN